MPLWTSNGQVVEGRKRIAKSVKYQVSWGELAASAMLPEIPAGQGPRLDDFKGWIRIEGRGRKRLDQVQREGRVVTLLLAGGWKLDVTLGGYDVNFNLYPLKPAPNTEFYR
jgi:hypothetical protein